jgi:hypothetical protein
MTAAQALEQKIRTAIPLSAAMQFSIVHGTGFAGSIYSAAILTGWALCTHVMDDRSLQRWNAGVTSVLNSAILSLEACLILVRGSYYWKLRLGIVHMLFCRQPLLLSAVKASV